MLRTYSRSIGLNYRRLWEVSIINTLASSSSSGNRRERGEEEYLRSTNFQSDGSLGYNNHLTYWKSSSPQSSEIKSCNVLQYNTKNLGSIMNDVGFSETGRVGIAFKSSGTSSKSSSNFVLVDQGLTTSSVTSMLEENPNLHFSLQQRRSLLIIGNHDDNELPKYTTPSHQMMVGGSLPSIDRSVSPFHQWRLGQAVRLATSKAGAADTEDDRKSSEEGVPRGSEDDKSAPRSIEDFQHEEIVGPTVERDLSDTADQVRESLTVLRSYMASFGTGFVLLGTVQLASAIWGSLILKTDSILLWRDLPFVIMSYTFAYLLRNTGSAMDFFSKMEGRSRIRILTLSLQVIKGFSQFFHRSGVMVKLVAFTTLLALIKQAFPLS